MKVVLLSSVLHPIDFDNVIRSGISLNPSHQHYYVSLIKALGLQHDVAVYSLFPRTRVPNMMKSKRGFQKATFHYAQPTASFILRWWRYRRLVFTALQSIKEPFIIIVDSASRLLLNLAKKITTSPKIVIITDHPQQLEHAKPRSIKKFFQHVSGFDGYLCLTPSLNDAFNRQGKPSLIVPGFAEARQVSSPQKRPYFFFSGALYEKYGINILLQAFLQLNRNDIDLIIAGHGPESSLIERLAMQHAHIRYLGLIDHQKVYQYQGNTLLNLHPRPLDAQRDMDSIPSKLFEYFSSGAPTMSTLHPFFFPRFAKESEWIEMNTPEAWTQQLRNFLSGDRLLAMEKAQRLKAMILKDYEPSRYSSTLTDFLNAVSSSKTWGK